MGFLECHIQNAYLQDPTSEKYCIIYGQELGLENVGKAAMIHRSAYDGKVASRVFRNHLTSCMEHLGFTPCLSDPNTWVHPATKENSQECCDKVLLCTENALVMSDEAGHTIRNQAGK